MLTWALEVLNDRAILPGAHRLDGGPVFNEWCVLPRRARQEPMPALAAHLNDEEIFAVTWHLEEPVTQAAEAKAQSSMRWAPGAIGGD